LNGLLAAALTLTHLAIGELRTTAPTTYLMCMVAVGALVYAPAFLFLPLSGIESEAARWRGALQSLRARFG